MDCGSFDISSAVVPPPPVGAHASTNRLPPRHRASTPPIHQQGQWSRSTHQHPPSPHGGTYHLAQFQQQQQIVPGHLPPSNPSRAPNVWNGAHSHAHGSPDHGFPAHGSPV